jgi:hypothetical protein
MLNNILKIIKTLDRFQDLENGKTLVHQKSELKRDIIRLKIGPSLNSGSCPGFSRGMKSSLFDR